MKETIDCIMNRRSIRAYKDEQIKEEELQNILLAGMHAPSAMNQQSWHFTVIQNRKTLEMLNLSCIKYMNFIDKFFNKTIQEKSELENYHVFFHAPTLIIVSCDMKYNLSCVDCAAALENMLVAATSMDIGSCWISATANLFKTKRGESLMDELCIPKGFKPLYSAVFGYKSIESQKVTPRKNNVVNYLR